MTPDTILAIASIIAVCGVHAFQLTPVVMDFLPRPAKETASYYFTLAAVSFCFWPVMYAWLLFMLYTGHQSDH